MGFGRRAVPAVASVRDVICSPSNLVVCFIGNFPVSAVAAFNILEWTVLEAPAARITAPSLAPI